MLGKQAGSGGISAAYDRCTLIGNSAGSSVLSGDDNTFIGYNAGKFNNGSANTLIGSSVGASMGPSNVLSTFEQCTLIGCQVAPSLYSGIKNTIIGHSCATALSTGASNTVVGYNAGSAMTSAVSNCLVGALAGNGLTVDAQTVAVGQQALEVGRGTNCVAVGFRSLQNCVSDSNTSIGAHAGKGVSGQSTFNQSVLLGYFAGTALTSGNGNTFIGYQTGQSATTSTANVLVGRSNDVAATGITHAYTLGVANVANHSECIILGTSITTVAANTIYLGSSTFPLTTSTTAPSAGGAGALPATPAGYLRVYVNGTLRQIPYY